MTGSGNKHAEDPYADAASAAVVAAAAASASEDDDAAAALSRISWLSAEKIERLFGQLATWDLAGSWELGAGSWDSCNCPQHSITCVPVLSAPAINLQPHLQLNLDLVPMCDVRVYAPSSCCCCSWDLLEYLELCMGHHCRCGHMLVPVCAWNSVLAVTSLKRGRICC